MDVWVEGTRVRLDPARSIGKGGEADVFDVGGGRALKLWKTPDHPDYAGSPSDRDAAAARLATQQTKLPRFPPGLPARVVAPRALATDRKDAKIVGYTMDLVAGAEVLLRYGEPSFGRAVPRELAVRVLLDLHATVEGLHARGVVVGDFNDLNVLVRGAEAFLIDADSYQYGGFLASVYTERFVDPTLCDASAIAPALARPYQSISDWYSFAAMTLQTLCFVGPWGGVHKPADPKKRVPQSRRALERVSVFDASVVLPRQALPLRALPDELLHELRKIFDEDLRAPFPRALLERLRFSTCATCGREHARASCPTCTPSVALVPPKVLDVRGDVTAELLFATKGTVVAVAIDGAVVRWIAHEGGRYVREDGREIVRGALDPSLFFAIDGATTLVGKRGSLVAIDAGGVETIGADSLGARPLVAIGAEHRFLVRGGVLLRARRAGDRGGALAIDEERVGDVLAGQTLFWIGRTFGVGFYRAGALSVGFVFDASRIGLNDRVALPRLGGQLVAATATLDRARAWLFLASEEMGRTIHRAIAIARDGRVEATAEAVRGDGTWLGTLGGKCAANGALLAPTDGGVVRVEIANGAIVETRRFPETEPFVDAATELFVSSGGLVAANATTIRRLRID